MSHTKGPWRAEAEHTAINSHIFPLTVRSEEWAIAEVYGDVSHIPAEANAHLIAAAPDLLEALEAYDDFIRNELAVIPIMDFLKDKPELEAVYLKGCEAIAKATGGLAG